MTPCMLSLRSCGAFCIGITAILSQSRKYGGNGKDKKELKNITSAQSDYDESSAPTPSLKRYCRFLRMPRLYPPREPSDLTTRWHGIFGLSFVLRMFPTARYALGLPARRATSLYVSIEPRGIFETTRNTLSRNAMKLV